MALSVIRMVLPVLVMILIGYLTNRKGIISKEGLSGVKSFVSHVTLPAVLFNAFFTADYTKTTIISFTLVYAALGLAMLIGFALRKAMHTPPSRPAGCQAACRRWQGLSAYSGQASSPWAFPRRSP